LAVTVAGSFVADACSDDGRPVIAGWHLAIGPGPVICVTVLSLHAAAKAASASATNR
jgi:hypothetical protein